MSTEEDILDLFDLVPAHTLSKYLRRLLMVYLKYDPEACLDDDFDEMIRDLESIFDFLDELQDKADSE